MAAMRFSLSSKSSFRWRKMFALSWSAWRWASSGPWSMMAQMKWANSFCGFSMRAMCKSPVNVPLDPARKITSLSSLVPSVLAFRNETATTSACSDPINGSKKFNGGSLSNG